MHLSVWFLLFAVSVKLSTRKAKYRLINLYKLYIFLYTIYTKGIQVLNCIKYLSIHLFFTAGIMCSSLAHSQELDPEMVDRAKGVHTSAGSHYNDVDSLQQNVTHPVTSGGSLATADGTSFNAQIGCRASNTFMKVLVIPTGSGEANFNIEVDKDMDSTVDTVLSESGVSGICSNGFVKCTPGTWDDCIGYEWFVDGGMNVTPTSLSGTEFTETLKSCYCVNNSCGSNLVISNMSNIVKDFGSGLANAFQQRNPYYTISAVVPDGPYTTFYGQEPASCASGFNTSLSGFKDTPGSLSTAAFSAASSHTLYDKVTTSVAASNETTTITSCSIQREVTIDEIEITDIIEFVGGIGSVSYCGSDCIELTIGTDGDNYWSGSCKAYDTVTKFNVKQPHLIREAKLVKAKFDDWLYISNDGDKVYAAPYNWSGGLSPPSGYSCELNTDWNLTPNLDFTDTFSEGGVVELKTRTLVSGNGEGFTKVRIYVDLEQTVEFDINIGAPGDEILSYSFDLMNNTSTVLATNAPSQTIQMPTGIDFEDLCTQGYEFNLVSKAPWNPPAPYDSPNFDTSVDVTSVQVPTCANGLNGVVKVEDQTSEGGYDPDYSLGAKFKYRATKPACGLSSETIDNACISLESNSSCTLMDELIDGIQTYDTFVSTGLSPIAQTQTITSGVCSLNISRPWFDADRTYSCETSTPPYDLSFAQNRLDTINSSASTTGFSDITVNDSGETISSSHSFVIPDTPELPGCVQSCKTKKLKTDSQVNILGNTSAPRSDQSTYDYYYHQCDVSSACPVGDGETLVTPCQCMNTFNEAASMLQVLRLSGSDMICSSGTAVPVE